PLDYEKSWPGVWEYNTVWDVGQAAKDWPQVNFVIYHAALRSFLETPDAALAEFDQTGRIKWATDLAEIPAKFGVTNVYGELGTADGLVKSAIFGGNSTRLYKLDTRSAQGTITRDKIAAIKAEYVAMGGARSNTRYGYVHRATA